MTKPLKVILSIGGVPALSQGTGIHMFPSFLFFFILCFFLFTPLIHLGILIITRLFSFLLISFCCCHFTDEYLLPWSIAGLIVV